MPSPQPASVAQRAIRTIRRRSGAAFLVSSKFIVLPLTTVATVALARWLQPEDFGKYALAASVIATVNSFGLVGQDQLYLRRQIEISQLFRNLLAWQAAFIPACSLALYASAMSDSDLLIAGLLMSAGAAMQACSAPFTLKPQRALQYAIKARRDIAVRILSVAPLLAVALALPPSLNIAGAAGLAAGITILALALLVSKPLKYAQAPSTRSTPLRSAVRRSAQQIWAGLPYGLQSALIGITRQAPILLTGLLASATFAGQARVAMSVYGIAGLTAVALNNDIARPRLFANATNWRNILKWLLILNLTISTVTAGIVYIAAPNILYILFGPGYGAAADILATMMLGLPFFFFASLIDTVLVVIGYKHSITIRLATGLAVTVALVYAIGDTPAGLASAVVISEIVSLVLVLPSVWKARSHPNLIKESE